MTPWTVICWCIAILVAFFTAIICFGVIGMIITDANEQRERERQKKQTDQPPTRKQP